MYGRMSRMTVDVHVARTLPKDVDAVAVPVGTRGPVPRSLGLNRAALTALASRASPGRRWWCRRRRPDADRRRHRRRRADRRRSAQRCGSTRCAPPASAASIATSLADLEGVDAATAAQAVVEGALLAAYRYHGLKTEPPHRGLQDLTLVVGERRTAGATLGARARLDHRRRREPRQRPGQHAAGAPHGADDRRQGSRARRGQRARRRGVQQGPADRDGLRRDGRGQQGQRRAAAHGPPHVHAAQPARSPRAGRQGRDVRLRRPQPQDQRRHEDDEDGHERRGRGAGGDDDAQGAEVQGRPSPAT